MPRGSMSLLLLVVPALALGAPPPLVLVTPRDGGWVGPRMDFVVRLDGGNAYGTLFNRVEYRVLNADDTIETSMTAAVSPLDNDTYRSVTVPLDAGLYRWTARTLDASDASVWAPPELFRWDGVSPPASAFITLDDVDAGGVRVSYGAIVDDESGLSEYHPAISFEGAADAGIDFSNAMLQTQQLTSSTWLGPGTWRLAVHGHDRAGNVGAWVETPPIVVTASAELGGVTPTSPQLFFMDAGAVPAPAILNSSTFRGRWTDRKSVV